MDNRVNKIRKKISALRLEMRETEGAMRKEVAHDVDCCNTATRLMAMRAELAGLVGNGGRWATWRRSACRIFASRATRGAERRGAERMRRSVASAA
jgi:hypothetical protein